MKRTILSLSLAVLTAVTASAYNKQSIDISVNGQQRNMVVFTPNTLPAKSPLFIVTHGMNQDPKDTSHEARPSRQAGVRMRPVSLLSYAFYILHLPFYIFLLPSSVFCLMNSHLWERESDALCVEAFV